MDLRGLPILPWTNFTYLQKRKPCPAILFNVHKRKLINQLFFFFLLTTEYPRQAFGPTQTNLCDLWQLALRITGCKRGYATQQLIIESGTSEC